MVVCTGDRAEGDDSGHLRCGLFNREDERIWNGETKEAELARREEEGSEDGVQGAEVRRDPAGRLRPGAPVRGPGGVHRAARVRRAGEAGGHRSGQGAARAREGVLPPRGRQPLPEVPPHRAQLPRLHQERRLGQGRQAHLRHRRLISPRSRIRLLARTIQHQRRDNLVRKGGWKRAGLQLYAEAVEVAAQFA